MPWENKGSGGGGPWGGGQSGGGGGGGGGSDGAPWVVTFILTIGL